MPKMAFVSLRPVFTGALLLCISAGPLLGATEGERLDNPEEMSLDVGLGLNEVITLNDAQKFEEAAAALQRLRDTFAGRLDAYEEFRVLQASAHLNTARQKYPEALADYEAILALGDAPEADSLAALDAAAQLYLEQEDWSHAVNYLLDANALRDGSDADTLSRIAYAYSQLERITDAILFMEQALAAAGPVARAHRGRAGGGLRVILRSAYSEE